MKAWRWPVVALVGALGLAVALTASARDGAVGQTPVPAFTPGELTALPAENFIGWNGNILNQRYSSLNQINVSNVRNLKIQWHKRLAIRGQKYKPPAFGTLAEQSPVVYDGVLYMPDFDRRVWALNAGTGERIWASKPKQKKPLGLGASIPNRGIAIGDGKVYFAASDASIMALDQATGRLVWRKVLADNKKGHAFTAAPTYYNGMVFVPGSGGDAGAASFFAAVNAKTGREMWRFNVIPQKPGDPGYETWPPPSKRFWNGGGALWGTPAVDPQLGLVYFGTGNADPYSGLNRPRNKDLFTASIVALSAKTGKMRWHFQMVHHDIWDYACMNSPVLFDLPRPGGGTVKGVGQACKTGYLYLFDRATGRPLYGIPEKKVPQSAKAHTWPTQPIPNGEPFSNVCPPRRFVGKKGPDGKVYRVGCIYEPVDDTRYTVSAPSALGGANWPPSAYSPRTQYMYICSKDSVLTFKSVPAAKQKLRPLGDFGQVEGLTGSAGGSMTGRLVAMNLRNNRIAWQSKWPELCYSGTLATAGDLVFVGRSAGYLEAYHARTGRRVWRSKKLLAGVNAAPVTYSVNGKQYVSVFAGGNGIVSAFGGAESKAGNSLYTFALPS